MNLDLLVHIGVRRAHIRLLGQGGQICRRTGKGVGVPIQSHAAQRVDWLSHVEGHFGLLGDGRHCLLQASKGVRDVAPVQREAARQSTGLIR